MKKNACLLIFVAFCVTFSFNFMFIEATTASNSRSSVIFTFDGLQVLAFGDPNRVSDGILDVAHHTPKIEIKQIDAKGKEKIIASFQGKELYRKYITVSMPNKLNNPNSINSPVNTINRGNSPNSSNTANIASTANSNNTANANNTNKPTRYYSPDMQKDKQDFRWCLDMESDLFQKQLYLNENKLFAKIHFSVGTFFSASVTDEKYKFIAASKIHSFNRQLGTPGARVELQPNDALVIGGLDKEITLPYQIGTSYKVDVTNLPPREMASVDHFGFYYDAVKDQSVSRFMPVMVEKASYYPGPLICETVILGKSSIR